MGDFSQKDIEAIEALRHRVLESVRGENREALSDPSKHKNYLERVTMLEAKKMDGNLSKDAYKQVVDDLLGYGPLNKVLSSSSVTELVIARYDLIFAEYGGVLTEEKNLSFRDERHFRAVLDKVAMTAGRRLDRNNTYVDARLPDGTRVQISVPPMSVRGASANFRRFPKYYTTDELVDMGTMSGEMVSLMDEVQKEGCNIVVTGQMGSGKTTILNERISRISKLLYPEASVVIYEDICELNPSHRNIRQFESQPPNINGQGGITFENMVKQQMLRTRADVIVIGEMCNEVAYYVIAAMTVGNSVLSTFHANDASEAIKERLPHMYLMDKNRVNITQDGALDEISYCVDFIIQMGKIVKKHGNTMTVERKVVQLAEVMQKHNPITGMMVPDVRVLFEWDGKKVVQLAEPMIFKKKKRWQWF
jgi:pilus assembly protein CpaF